MSDILLNNRIVCATKRFGITEVVSFKRDLDFKTLFWVRIEGILIPVVVTIPVVFLLLKAIGRLSLE